MSAHASLAMEALNLMFWLFVLLVIPAAYGWWRIRRG
jgi:hypothetical protein